MLRQAAFAFVLAVPTAPPAAASGPQLLAPGVVTRGGSETHAALSPDGSTLFFLELTPDFAHWTLVLARQCAAGWCDPEIAWFSGRWDDADLSFSPDGREIYFVSTRPDRESDADRGETDIFRMRRVEEGWSAPERIVELSSPGFEWFPNLTAGGTLYFGSERRPGNLGPAGTSDLWRSRKAGERFGEPENLGPGINGAGQEIEPWISADERLLVFAAKGRSDSQGDYDLYASHLCAGEWSPPRPLAGGVNSPAWDFAGRFSPDGKSFYFASNRSLWKRPERALAGRDGYRDLGERLRSPGNGLFDLYVLPASELGIESPCAEVRR